MVSRPSTILQRRINLPELRGKQRRRGAKIKRKQMNELNSRDAERDDRVPAFVLGLVNFCLLNAAFFRY
jgi:hypothetical protein